MVTCPSCSAEHVASSKYCSDCGTSLRPEEETITRARRQEDQGTQSSLSDSSHHGRFLPGAKVADRYRIVSLVGAGGMGEVYRADDLKLGHTVALKFLPKDLGNHPQLLDYFRSEVRLTRQISHPNVCRVYDIGDVDGTHFLSMEYIDGEDLKVLLRRIGRLPNDKGIEIAQQVCAGLSAAHDKGILHRDLKPANIMLDGQGQVRITDFGLARLAAEGTKAEVAGTPAYMAPEQLAHGEATIQSDLYSLGLILYELFTGQPVHRPGSIPDLLRAHEESSLTKPSSVIDDIDSSTERVIMQCLEKEPQHRPTSAHAVAAALPGGDPLAAALAAGETPSPELVANVRDTGSLRPAVAVAILVSAIAAFVLYFAHTTDYTVLPDQPAGVLAIRAADMLEDFGYASLPENSVHGMMRHDAYLAHIGKPGPPGWSVLEECHWPPAYLFWRRWSSDGFETRDIHWPWPSHKEPPQSAPGSITVVLDTHRRLVALNIIPDGTLPALEEPDVADVQKVISSANLNDDELQPRDKPAWAPPTYCDSVRAWSGQRPDDEGGDFVAQAGWYRGRLVYFEIHWEWDEQGVLKQVNYDRFHPLSRIAYFFSNAGVILPFFLIFAWRNFRLGRSDLQGALCCALLIAGGYFVREIASVRLGEVGLIDLIDSLVSGRHLGHALIHGFQAWVGYLAIEPYVRRTWPRSLVGWTRFSRGRFRDPQVGREVLIGILLGLLVLIPAAAVAQLAWAFGWPHGSPLHSHPQALVSAVWALMSIIPADSMIFLIWGYVWLVVARVVTRNDWTAIAFAIALNVAVNYDIHHAYYGGESTTFDPATVTWLVLLSVAGVLAMVRLGFISAICVHFTARVMLVIPMSAQFPLDFGTQMFLGMGLVLGLAVYGFYVCLGRRPLFREPISKVC